MKGRLASRLGVALLAAATAVAPYTAGATVVISDQTFNTADWTVTVGSASNGATQNATQVASGGNPGSAREMSNTLPGLSAISVWQVFNAMSYDASTQGAIASIDYSEDRIVVSPPFGGAAIGALFLLQQGSGIWYADTDLTFSNLEWTTRTLTGLLASDFVLLAGTGSVDFSSSGAPMYFGILRSNSNTEQNAGYTTHNRLDNWRVMINQVPVGNVPEPGTLALLSLGLAAVGLSRRRKTN